MVVIVVMGAVSMIVIAGRMIMIIMGVGVVIMVVVVVIMMVMIVIMGLFLSEVFVGLKQANAEDQGQWSLSLLGAENPSIGFDIADFDF